MKPTFNTKEEYLVWRKTWRERYTEISREIRELKLAHRVNQSGIEKPKWQPVAERVQATIKRYYNPAFNTFMWWKVGSFQTEARQMLEWRKESKLRAQEQYLKAAQAAQAPQT